MLFMYIFRRILLGGSVYFIIIFLHCSNVKNQYSQYEHLSCYPTYSRFGGLSTYIFSNIGYYKVTVASQMVLR